MGTQSQHIPVTAHTCASPVDKHPEQGPGSQSWEWGSGTATFREGTRRWLHLQVPRGSHPPLVTPLETPQPLQLPVRFTSETWWKCWCTRLLGFSILVLYHGRETKDFISKSEAKSEGTSPHLNSRADNAGIWPGWKARGRVQKAAASKTSHLYSRMCIYS